MPWTSHGSGAHVCAVATGGADRAAHAAAWVREGLDAGERVQWIERPDGWLLDVLRFHGVAWRQPLDRGQLQLVRPEDVLGVASATEIPSRVAAACAQADRAVAEGWTGLRVGVDTAVALEVMPDGVTQLAFEDALEKCTRTHPLSALCLYDPEVYGEAMARAVAAHPRGLTDRLALAATGDDGVQLVGEIDRSNAETFGRFLTTAVAGGHSVIDLSGLSFIDLGGAAELVTLSRSLHPDRLRVVAPPPGLTTILNTVGWSGEIDVVAQQAA